MTWLNNKGIRKYSTTKPIFVITASKQRTKICSAQFGILKVIIYIPSENYYLSICNVGYIGDNIKERQKSPFPDRERAFVCFRLKNVCYASLFTKRVSFDFRLDALLR